MDQVEEYIHNQFMQHIKLGISLKSQISITSTKIIKFVTPFLYPDGDCIEVWVEKIVPQEIEINDSKLEPFLVTDGGETIEWLVTHGLIQDDSQAKLKQIMDRAGKHQSCNWMGQHPIELTNEALSIIGTKPLIGQMIFHLVTFIMVITHEKYYKTE